MAQNSLSVTKTSAAANVSTLGAADWAVWNGTTASLTPNQRKSGGGSQISASLFGGGAVGFYLGDPRTISWTSDGTPTASGSSDGGIYSPISGTGIGFGVQAIFPASTTTRRAWVYVGYYDAVVARVTSILSDGSVGNQVDSTTLTGSAATSFDGYVVVDYAAARAGQTLTVRIEVLTEFTGGNATLQAAAFADIAPVITVQPTNQSTNSGSTATFTALASGSGGAITYQWQDDRTGSFTNVASGGTSASYTTPNTDATYQGRSYQVVATDSNGSVTSGTAQLNVLGLPVYLWDTSVQSGNDVWLRNPLIAGAGGLTLALAGQSVTAAPGTVSAAVALAISGQDVTSASGTITAATGAPVTVSVTGQTLSVSTGTLAPSLSVAATGQTVGASSGSITLAASVSIAGTGVVASSGTLAPAASVSIAGTTVSATSGVIGPSVSLSLSGTAVGASAGLLTPSVSVTLNGQGVTGSTGTITASAGANLTLNLSGQDVSASSGSLTPSAVIALSGQVVTGSAGSVGVAVGPALSGQGATFAAGTLTPAFSLTLAGQSVTADAGSLTALIPGDLVVALSGQDASFIAGNLLASSGNQATGGFALGSLRGFERKTLTRAQIREQQLALGIIKDFPQQAAIEVVKGFIDPDVSSAELAAMGADIAEQSARMSRLLGLVIEWQHIQDALEMQVRIRRDEEQAIMLVLSVCHAWQ